MNRTLQILLVTLVATGCDTTVEHEVVGTLERDRIVLTAEAREPVIAIQVREGDRVDAGAKLLELDPARAKAELERLHARETRLQRRLDELVRGPRSEAVEEYRARLAAAGGRLEVAVREHERALELHDDGLGSAREVDQARRERDIAQGEHDAARAALDALLTGTTIEELDQARAELEENGAMLDAQRTTIERLTLVSPREARVESLPFELGETPAQGAPLAVLRALDVQPYARVYIPASLHARMTPGTDVRVRVAGGDYRGTIRFVSGEAAFTPYFALTEHDADRLSYLAEIDLEGAEDLPSGIPVRVVTPAEAR